MTPLAPHRFAFDAERHVYSIDGQRVPSVTGALSLLVNFDGVPAAVLDRARERGTTLAHHINLWNRGLVTIEQVPVDVQPGVAAWEKFLAKHGYTVVDSERPLFHTALRYGGTPDSILSDTSGEDRFVLPDVKASYAIPPTVGPQTMAYKMALQEKQPRLRVDRCCVHIKDGEFVVKWLREDARDRNLFVSCLNVVNYLEKHYGVA